MRLLNGEGKKKPLARAPRVRLRFEADVVDGDGMRVIYAIADIEPDAHGAPVSRNAQVLVKVSELLTLIDNERRRLADGD
jgi:hypothetical protein